MLHLLKQAIKTNKQSITIPITNKNIRICLLLHKLGLISSFNVSNYITLRLKLHESSQHNAMNNKSNNHKTVRTLKNTFQKYFNDMNFNIVVFNSKLCSITKRKSLDYSTTLR